MLEGQLHNSQDHVSNCVRRKQKASLRYSQQLNIIGLDGFYLGSYAIRHCLIERAISHLFTVLSANTEVLFTLSTILGKIGKKKKKTLDELIDLYSCGLLTILSLKAFP